MGERRKNVADRQALIAGYLNEDVKVRSIEGYRGHKFLKKPKSFKIVEDNDFEGGKLG